MFLTALLAALKKTRKNLHYRLRNTLIFLIRRRYLYVHAAETRSLYLRNYDFYLFYWFHHTCSYYGPTRCKGMVLVSSSEPSYVMRIVISTLSDNREGRFYKVSGISVLEDSSMMYFKAFRESYSYIICHKGLNEVKNTLPYS